jgi:aspartate oxidase
MTKTVPGVLDSISIKNSFTWAENSTMDCKIVESSLRVSPRTHFLCGWKPLIHRREHEIRGVFAEGVSNSTKLIGKNRILFPFLFFGPSPIRKMIWK